MYSIWKEKKGFFDALINLKESVKQLLKTEDTKSYINAYNKVYVAISNLTRFSPVVISIRSVTPPKKLLIIERLPEWLLVKSDDLSLKNPQIIEAVQKQ